MNCHPVHARETRAACVNSNLRACPRGYGCGAPRGTPVAYVNAMQRRKHIKAASPGAATRSPSTTRARSGEKPPLGPGCGVRQFDVVAEPMATEAIVRQARYAKPR
jgi:hypothetical protein